MPRNICVFASSSDVLAPVYYAAAETLGREIGARGDTLIYGGGKIGLMGAVARGVHASGGRVVGVIPQKLLTQGYKSADEMVITETMRERKAIMAERADAFIALPGGFGTLEEVLEVMTLKQLGYHAKPVVLLNTASYFSPLITMFEHSYTEQFVNPLYRVLYHLTADIHDALDYLDTYRPPELPTKWIWDDKR